MTRRCASPWQIFLLTKIFIISQSTKPISVILRNQLNDSIKNPPRNSIPQGFSKFFESAKSNHHMSESLRESWSKVSIYILMLSMSKLHCTCGVWCDRLTRRRSGVSSRFLWCVLCYKFPSCEWKTNSNRENIKRQRGKVFFNKISSFSRKLPLVYAWNTRENAEEETREYKLFVPPLIQIQSELILWERKIFTSRSEKKKLRQRRRKV